MVTRISNPNIKGACFIVENVLKRLSIDAVKRCGLHDSFYAIFLKENINAFSETLDENDRNIFLSIANEKFPSFDDTQILKDAIKEIEEE